MALKIEMFRAFVAVAECGNLTDAAARLGRTPSALSMTLKQFEEHLGQALFEGERKNRLTPLGEYVLEQAQNELRHFGRTVQAIEAHAKAPGGLLRVAAVPTVAGLVLPGALRRFTARYPAVEIELRDMDSALIRHELGAGRLDLGIASAGDALNGFVRTPLYDDAFGLICAADDPLAMQARAPSLADLAHRYIDNALSATTAVPELMALSAAAQVRAQNIISLLALVRAGFGVTVLPQSAIRLGPSGLTFRRLHDLSVRRHVALIRRETGTASQLAAAFGADVISAVSEAGLVG